MANHVATVSAMYEAFGRGDIPAILNHLADDVQWEAWNDHSGQKAGVPWLIARTGKAGATEFFRIVGEQLRFKEFNVLSLMSNNNQVAAEVALVVEVASTGVVVRDEEIHLWTFNDAGKVTRFRHYVDTAKHITAAKK